MSRVCPKDGKPCCDDLCHSAGCIDTNGEEMIEICSECGEWGRDCVCDYLDDSTNEEDTP